MKAITFAWKGYCMHRLIQNKFTIISMLLFCPLPPLHCWWPSWPLQISWWQKFWASKSHFCGSEILKLCLTLESESTALVTHRWSLLSIFQALQAKLSQLSSHEQLAAEPVERPQGWWELPNRGHEPKNRQARRATRSEHFRSNLSFFHSFLKLSSGRANGKSPEANPNCGTVFENHRKSLIWQCERSEPSLHFEWEKKLKDNA